MQPAIQQLTCFGPLCRPITLNIQINSSMTFTYCTQYSHYSQFMPWASWVKGVKKLSVTCSITAYWLWYLTTCWQYHVDADDERHDAAAEANTMLGRCSLALWVRLAACYVLICQAPVSCCTSKHISAARCLWNISSHESNRNRYTLHLRKTSRIRAISRDRLRSAWMESDSTKSEYIRSANGSTLD